MKKIKVVHMITLLELGGAQGNTLFTVTHLNREKFEVVLICGEGGIQDEEAKKIPKLKIYFIKNMVRPIHPLKDFLCLIELFRILKQEKADIVHTHSSKAGILGRIAARMAQTPVIIHSIHGFGFNPYQKYWVRKLFIFLEKWIAKISDILIVVSSKNIKDGLKLGIGKKEKYRLIRSGVDIQKIKNRAETSDSQSLRKNFGIPSEKKVILTVGPFKIQKDPLNYVRLAKKVSDQFSEVKFLMVGDGELREKIELLIHDLKLENIVTLLGWRKEIPELLKACDLFVLTSLWEGLPRAAVESLIVGKPVVAFGVDGVPEVVQNGENGFVLAPGNLDEMAEKIIRILKNHDLKEKLSQQALKSIDDSFDIHKMVRQQEELYAELCNRFCHFE